MATVTASAPPNSFDLASNFALIMTDDRIYVRFKGKTLGPLTVQKAQDLVRRGQITRLHELSSDGVTWKRAEEFGKFFQSPNAAATREEAFPGHGKDASKDVSEPAVAEPSLASPRTPEPADSIRVKSAEPLIQWYAHIDGENRGPLDISSIQTAMDSGKITGETLVWRAGFDSWKQASDCFPQQAAGKPAPKSDLEDSPPRSKTSPLATSNHSKLDLHYELQQQRPWVMFFAVVIMLTAVLDAIYCVGFMVVGANSQLTGSASVIAGLTGLTLSGLLLIGGWLLWRYAGVLKDIAIHRDERAPAEAARRLKVFLNYVGMTSLTLFGIAILAGVMIFMLAAGAGAGAILP